MRLAPGARLGPYEIQGPLGAGGMGEVYQLLFVEGKPNLNGVLWRIDPKGQENLVVLQALPLFTRHIDVSVPIRFDVHPDGRRIVIEALESYEADIGMIDNVR